jgi:hypothetical protein
VPDASRLPRPEPVRLSGRELGGASATTDDLWARALEYARCHVQGHTAVKAHTGWHISVGRRGLNETLNRSARREHVPLVPALLALLGWAR